jgi:hypothetical protein
MVVLNMCRCRVNGLLDRPEALKEESAKAEEHEQ